MTALPLFRATSLARYAGKYPRHLIPNDLAYEAADAVAKVGRSNRLGEIARAASRAAVAAATDDAVTAAQAAMDAIDASILATQFNLDSVIRENIELDAWNLNAQDDVRDLADAELWRKAPSSMIDEWNLLESDLLRLGQHWGVWTRWYENIFRGRWQTDAYEAAFTDEPGQLQWEDSTQAVNAAIAQRLAKISSVRIPEQSTAPVRVEERNGKISKASDRNSPLKAAEHDFTAWRDPVVEHIDELSEGDFRAGTNHGRVRDRLLILGKLLPGEITEVKDRQFRIGYEIERFEGLVAAYRSGGDDMPTLNAAQLEDLDRLRIALKMGVDKLERWSEFRRQAIESAAREGEADGAVVGDTLDEMAATMDRQPQYFDPEMPETFRFLAEAARDPQGATKTVVYGAIKSAENLISFLGQRALGVGKKGAEATETHISKAIAASLIAGLSAGALKLSGALPYGWAWLKPLLTALGIG